MAFEHLILIKRAARQGTGQVIAELLISLAMFTLAAAVVAFVLIDALPAHRLGEERVRALALAEEGLEAARVIRDNSYAGLTNGNHGIALSGQGRWTFSGTSDITGPFTRVVFVTRLSAGRADVKSTVTWRFAPQRDETIILNTRFTNWQ